MSTVETARETHLTIVDADDTANRDDNHVVEVGLHDCRLLVWEGLLRYFPELFEEAL